MEIVRKIGTLLKPEIQLSYLSMVYTFWWGVVWIARRFTDIEE